MGIFRRLNQAAIETRYLALELEHDVELTVFGDGGRDVTMKGYAGDTLILGEVGGRWVPFDILQCPSDLFDPIEEGE